MLRLLSILLFISSSSVFSQALILPYTQIDNPPLYQGCTNESREDTMVCTQNAIDAFARSKCNTALFKGLNLNEKRVRVYAQFRIDTSGAIKDILVRTAHPQLEKEIKRVLGLLPNLQPGTHLGKPVEARYTLPLVFTLG